ncbi:MAG: glycerol-3-phosphate 1-O-acyltransferase PlsY [Candidatus Sumerlaeia bacterium]|nr:glycerol-3-phosphate 1-O-acyltransferase PlsY [Candidatus Sumerlaeia bacterium]
MIALILGQISLAYVVGGIPTGLIIGKVFAGIDLREHGSKNIGFTNALRVLGPKLGIPVLLIDVVKAVLPIVLLPWLMPLELNPEVHSVSLGLAVLLGNLFSLFMGFKGGKGVATSLGVFLALAPLSVLIALGAFILAFALTRYVSMGSLVSAVVLPTSIGILHGPGYTLAMGVAAAVFVVFKHRANVERLMKGTEHKWGAKKGTEKPHGDA